jgi:hypothetical protein
MKANALLAGNWGKTGPTIQGNNFASSLNQVPENMRNRAASAGVLPERRAGRPVSNDL